MPVGLELVVLVIFRRVVGACGQDRRPVIGIGEERKTSLVGH